MQRGRMYTLEPLETYAEKACKVLRKIIKYMGGKCNPLISVAFSNSQRDGEEDNRGVESVYRKRRNFVLYQKTMKYTLLLAE